LAGGGLLSVASALATTGVDGRKLAIAATTPAVLAPANNVRRDSFDWDILVPGQFN
jgi:hypothetical protein